MEKIPPLQRLFGIDEQGKCSVSPPSLHNSQLGELLFLATWRSVGIKWAVIRLPTPKRVQMSASLSSNSIYAPTNSKSVPFFPKRVSVILMMVSATDFSFDVSISLRVDYLSEEDGELKNTCSVFPRSGRQDTTRATTDKNRMKDFCVKAEKG